jgi:hypothetical protein
VLGLMLLLARLSRALVWVPAAVGAIPLTLYTVHVAALAARPSTLGELPTADLTLWMVHVGAAVLVGVTIAAIGVRGPLESVVSRLSRLARQAVAGAATGR